MDVGRVRHALRVGDLQHRTHVAETSVSVD